MATSAAEQRTGHLSESICVQKWPGVHRWSGDDSGPMGCWSDRWISGAHWHVQNKTTSYLAAQNFLILLPSWWKLYNPVLRGKQSCWALVGLFISLACFCIAGVYSWLAWYFKENSCGFERKNNLHKDVFCCLLAPGCKAGEIEAATWHWHEAWDSSSSIKPKNTMTECLLPGNVGECSHPAWSQLENDVTDVMMSSGPTGWLILCQVFSTSRFKSSSLCLVWTWGLS